MDVIKFETKLKGRTHEICFDPFVNQVYPASYEGHFKNIRGNSHYTSQTGIDKFPKSEGEAIDYIARHNSRLKLELTQNCNLRCKYCFYNPEVYPTRAHTNKSMSPEILTRAVDYYQKLKSSPTARNQFNISFYGGEPSLEPGLVYQAVKETREKMKDCHVGYYFTSNGTFYRNDELIDFLIRNNFLIQFSIDGIQEEHDRFRVDRKGQGCYSDVIKLLNKMKNYPRVKVLITMHPDHDWQRLDELYAVIGELNSDWQINLSIVEVNVISNEDMKIDLKERLQAKLLHFREKIIGKLERDMPLSPVEENYLKSLFTDYSFNFTNHWKKSRFVKTCFPGAEILFVDVEGNFHMCEKIPTSMVIGDIHNGLNPRAIFELWNEIHHISRDLECHDCPYQNLCNFCFSKLQGGCDRKSSFACDEHRKQSMQRVLEFICRVKMLGGLR